MQRARYSVYVILPCRGGVEMLLMLASLCRYVPVSLGKLPKESGKSAPKASGSIISASHRYGDTYASDGEHTGITF